MGLRRSGLSRHAVARLWTTSPQRCFASGAACPRCRLSTTTRIAPAALRRAEHLWTAPVDLAESDLAPR